MVVTDNDVGENARYALSIRDVRHSKGLFNVQPDAGVGRTPVIVRVRSKEGMDYDVQDPDKRKIQFDVVVHATDETVNRKFLHRFSNEQAYLTLCKNYFPFGLSEFHRLIIHDITIMKKRLLLIFL